MVDSISTVGMTLGSIKSLSDSQSMLSTLSEQLTTGKYSSNLTDYTSANAQKLLNFNSDIAQQKGFLSVITAISPRMDVYESALNGIEDVTSDATTALVAAQTYNSMTNASLASQIQSYMEQMTYFLNQQVGDRFVFSGSRYGQAPVGDITALSVPPTEVAPYLATGDTVPAYDTDYDPLDPAALVPEANVNEQAAIDTSKKLTYGITSNEDGFQQIIMGLRWAYAATQDQANYTTYMSTARDLLTDGLANVRATHTDSTNAYLTLEQAQETIESTVTGLKDQIDNIESVDLNEVAVKITSLQAQLEASYSSIAQLVRLSIIDFL